LRPFKAKGGNINQTEEEFECKMENKIVIQECALFHASRLRQIASEYRQMGFKELSRFCIEQAKKAEKYASKMFASY